MSASNSSADIPPSQEELEMLQLMQDGPVRHVTKQFELVLTVPHDLRQRIFYWPEEREFCEHISSIGRALDTLTAAQRAFFGQFKVLSNLRGTFIQAPTEYFVAPMYFCDRALDSLLRSTRRVQNNIEQLFRNLNALESECLWRYRWTKKAFLEDKYPKDPKARKDPCTQPDMAVKEQRVDLLAELSERIGMVRRGGNNVFLFLGRQWLPKYAHSQPVRQSDIIIPQKDANTLQEDPSLEKGVGCAQMDIDGSESPATPIQENRTGFHSRRVELGEKATEVPETPEFQRTGRVVPTQRSSPRKRKPSLSSGDPDAMGSPSPPACVTGNLIEEDHVGLQDSPVQRSGSSIVAIRAVNESDVGAMNEQDGSQADKARTRNKAGARVPKEPTSGQPPMSDAGERLSNPSTDQERHDQVKACSPSI